MLWARSQLRAWWFLAPVCGYLWFNVIIINQEFFLKETDAVCSTANPHHAFKRTPIHETALTLEFSPTFLTSSHTVYLTKRQPCQAAEFQLTSNMQFLCIPGPHCKQPTYSPSWHTNLLHKTGMFLLFQSAAKGSKQVTVPLDGTAVLCECGSIGMSLRFHTYWDLPTRLHVSHWDMAKTCVNQVAGECIRLANVLCAFFLNREAGLAAHPQLYNLFGWLLLPQPPPCCYCIFFPFFQFPNERNMA